MTVLHAVRAGDATDRAGAGIVFPLPSPSTRSPPPQHECPRRQRDSRQPRLHGGDFVHERGGPAHGMARAMLRRKVVAVCAPKSASGRAFGHGMKRSIILPLPCDPSGPGPSPARIRSTLRSSIQLCHVRPSAECGFGVQKSGPNLADIESLVEVGPISVNAGVSFELCHQSWSTSSRMWSHSVRRKVVAISVDIGQNLAEIGQIGYKTTGLGPTLAKHGPSSFEFGQHLVGPSGNRGRLHFGPVCRFGPRRRLEYPRP